MNATDPMRCTATSKQKQKQCGNNAIPGGNVCRNHGGAAPQVQRKAAERLAETRDRALEALNALIAAGSIDAKTALDAVVKLTETTETLEGRVARREEQVNVSEVDKELERLAEQLRNSASRTLPVATDGTT